MPNDKYESVEIPGVGEVRARPGTSTLELAGAVKHWHDKYQVAHKAGLINGVTIIAAVEVCAAALYYAFRLF